MDDSAIALTDISKCFMRYRHPAQRLRSLLFGANAGGQPFWALRQMSLSIRPGHTVGIVGRNGSGKSTLLQIVCGILRPTTGTVRARGRVSALLELGSGFNPEFTGRENAIFQGQILGLSRAAMDDQMPLIEAFAGIGPFLDQPTKTYSSGMAMRLAFAVAINVSPDVLIVDEALAVGDEAFQRKCFGRIRDLKDNGATILFVSHSAAAVVELCDRAILLEGGELLANGSPKEIVTAYHKLLFASGADRPAVCDAIRAELSSGAAAGDAAAMADMPADVDLDTTPAKTLTVAGHDRGADLSARFDETMAPNSTVSYPSRGAAISDARILDEHDRPVNILLPREWYTYTYRVAFSQAARRVRFGMMIKTVTGLELAGAVSHPVREPIPRVDEAAEMVARFRFQCLLAPGAYFLNAGVTGVVDGEEVYLHRVVDIAMCRVQPIPATRVTAQVDLLIQASVERNPPARRSPGAPATQDAHPALIRPSRPAGVV